MLNVSLLRCTDQPGQMSNRETVWYVIRHVTPKYHRICFYDSGKEWATFAFIITSFFASIHHYSSSGHLSVLCTVNMIEVTLKKLYNSTETTDFTNDK